jgi:hypothetical protein
MSCLAVAIALIGSRVVLLGVLGVVVRALVAVGLEDGISTVSRLFSVLKAFSTKQGTNSAEHASLELVLYILTSLPQV